MALRERLLIASSLVFGLNALGCGDGDGGGTSEDGGSQDMDGSMSEPMDAGGGGGDASSDGGRPNNLPTKMCGANRCEGNIIRSRVVNPCCVPDEQGVETSTCGFDAEDIKNANPASPFSGCVPRDVQAASESVYCGEFWDQVELDKTDNGGLDIRSSGVNLTFDGCCLPSGECGAKIDTPRGQGEEINSHLGCVSFTRLNEALNGADAGMTEQPKYLPFCNPSNGAPLTGTATVPGQPKFVCGCGEDKVDDGTGTFPCFNSLPTTVCGAADPTPAQLAMIPEFICGCPADPTKARLPCMINVPEATCGTKEIDANSAELEEVPVFVCGFDASKPTPLPTLKGVDPSVCGKKAPDASHLAQVPAFICGEIGNPDASSLPKMRNLPATTCGSMLIMTGNPYLEQVPEYVCGCPAEPGITCLRNVDPSVCGVADVTNSAQLPNLIPEFLCGCGNGKLTTASGLLCLPNVSEAICGTTPVTTAAPIEKYPEYICGCGDATRFTGGFPCLDNIPENLCGGENVTAAPAGVPEYLCGCGESVRSNPALPLPCLANVVNTICGMSPVTAGPISGYPEYICGCGDGVRFTGTTFTCLDNIPADLCGSENIETTPPLVPKFLCGCDQNPAKELGCLNGMPFSICGGADPVASQLANIPEFVCGCGTTSKDLSFGSVCMSFVDTGVCGTKDTQTSTRDLGDGTTIPCLVGVPEFAIGCGDGVAPQVGETCLRGAGLQASPASKVPGCDNVVANDPRLRRLPEYFCGCGDTAQNAAGRGDSSVPCLPFLSDALCGGIPISTSQQVSALIPNLLCGCGDGVKTEAANCLDNVPPSVCGAKAICALGGNGAAAGCGDAAKPVCADRRGGAGAGAGGLGGAGDGIGDECVAP